MQLAEFKAIYDAFEQTRRAASIDQAVWSATQETILQKVRACIDENSSLRKFLTAKKDKASYVEAAGTDRAIDSSSFTELLGGEEFETANRAEFNRERKGPMPEINFMSAGGHILDTRPIHIICATVSRFCQALIRNLEISDDSPRELKAVKVQNEEAIELIAEVGAMLTEINDSLVAALAERERQQGTLESADEEQPLTLEDLSNPGLLARLRTANVERGRTAGLPSRRKIST